MELSSKVKYGLLALLELASNYERGYYLQADQLAAGQKIPERYLAQLLMTLRRTGLVYSHRGAKGGYLLARAPQQISVFDVLTCLDGEPNQEQSEEIEFQTIEDILLAQVWEEATAAAIAIFQRYTLQDLCDKRNEKRQANPMYYI